MVLLRLRAADKQTHVGVMSISTLQIPFYCERFPAVCCYLECRSSTRHSFIFVPHQPSTFQTLPLSFTKELSRDDGPKIKNQILELSKLP